MKVGNFGQNPAFLSPPLEVKGDWQNEFCRYPPAALAAGPKRRQRPNGSEHGFVVAATNALRNVRATNALGFGNNKRYHNAQLFG